MIIIGNNITHRGSITWPLSCTNTVISFDTGTIGLNTIQYTKRWVIGKDGHGRAQIQTNTDWTQLKNIYIFLHMMHVTVAYPWKFVSTSRSHHHYTGLFTCPKLLCDVHVLLQSLAYSWYHLAYSMFSIAWYSTV